MPIHWYIDDGSTGGYSMASTSPWITTVSTPTNATTIASTCYLTVGSTGTVTSSVTLLPIYDARWSDSNWVSDSNWQAFQARARRVSDNMARNAESRPASLAAPAIIRERSEAERRRQEAEYRRQAERRALAAEAVRGAAGRARELLLEHLTPEQRRMFETNNWFLVEGGRSREQYRIRAGGYMGNVEIMKKGIATHRLCGHCEPSIPLGDQILAQKLMIEHAEDDFLRIANRSSIAL